MTEEDEEDEEEEKKKVSGLEEARTHAHPHVRTCIAHVGKVTPPWINSPTSSVCLCLVPHPTSTSDLASNQGRRGG